MGTNWKIKIMMSFMLKMVSVIIFLASITPWKNIVVERKNRTLKDIAITMLIASRLCKIF